MAIWRSLTPHKRTAMRSYDISRIYIKYFHNNLTHIVLFSCHAICIISHTKIMYCFVVFYHQILMTSIEDSGARNRYLRQGEVIIFHNKLWDVITYPCLRYLLLAPNFLNDVFTHICYGLFHCHWGDGLSQQSITVTQKSLGLHRISYTERFHNWAWYLKTNVFIHRFGVFVNWKIIISVIIICYLRFSTKSWWSNLYFHFQLPKLLVLLTESSGSGVSLSPYIYTYIHIYIHSAHTCCTTQRRGRTRS